MSRRAYPLPAIGDRFGRLTVVGNAHRGKVEYLIPCLCSCANQTRKDIKFSSLRRGETVSCGCYQRERTAEAHLTHGDAGRGGSLLYAR